MSDVLDEFEAMALGLPWPSAPGRAHERPGPAMTTTVARTKTVTTTTTATTTTMAEAEPGDITPLVAMFRERGIRIFGTVEDPLFSALDVATYIGDEHDYMRVVSKYSAEYALKMDAVNARGAKRLTWFLTEAGLYKYLLHAKGPKAEDFQTFAYGVLKKERKRTVDGVWLALRIAQSKNEELQRSKESLERNEARLYKAANDAREKNMALTKEVAALRKAKARVADAAYLTSMGRGHLVEDSEATASEVDEGDDTNDEE